MAAEVNIGGPDDGRDKYPQGSSESLVDALGGYDKDRLEVFRILEVVSRDPDRAGELDGILSHRASLMSEQFRSIVRIIADQEGGVGNNRFVNAVSTLIMGEDQRRGEFLSELMPGFRIQPVADGQLAGLKLEIQGLIRDVEEDLGYDQDIDRKAVSLVAAVNEGYVESDLDRFISGLQDQAFSAEEMGSMEYHLRLTDHLRNIAPKLGGAALDTLKIAVGVAAGVAIGSLFRKK